MQDLELRVLLGSSSKGEERIVVLLGWVSVGARKVQSAFSHSLPPQQPQELIPCLLLPSPAQTQQSLGQHPPQTAVNSTKTAQH